MISALSSPCAPRAEAHAILWGEFQRAHSRGDHEEAEALAERARALEDHADLLEAQAWEPPIHPPRLSASERAELQRVFDRIITEKQRVRDRPQARLQAPGRKYGLAALDDECRRVAGTERGNRNNVLASASYKVGQLVGGGYLDDTEAAANLLGAALDAGLGEAEARGVIRSGIAAGARKPREAE